MGDYSTWNNYVIPAVDLKTGRYIFHSCVYDDKDGLQNSGFNLRSIKKLSSGEILMGGLYGINRFRPDDIKYNKKTSQRDVYPFVLVQ